MKKVFSIFIFLICTILVNAQPPTEKALLWKISGSGITQSSYLFGTIHLMCPDQIKVDAILKECFSQVRQLYVEIDMDDPLMMTKMMQNMQMSNGESLGNLVSKADFDTMNNLFKAKAGMPLALMEKVKPMLIMSAVFPSIMGCSAPEGWEKQFQELAKQKKIPLKGLETIEYQLKVFDTIPYKVQAAMLKDLLLNIDSSQNSFNEMLKLYVAKDINKLYELTTKDDDFGNYDALLLINRNNNWVKEMNYIIKETPSFFAVGAAHLGGENGLISLLRKKGFQVTPVE